MSSQQLTIPPALKKIVPFIRRAEELDRDKANPESRLVAYYCRQFAVQQGIPLVNKDSASVDCKTCLASILEALEHEKLHMDNFTRAEAAFLCRKFANQVFDRADAQDRAGMADKDTAKIYYAAATFLQILEQFKDVQQSSEDEDFAAQDRKRVLYAKWKATDIAKALKEGRMPTPGSHGEFDEDGAEDAPTSSSRDTNSAGQRSASTNVETVSDNDDSDLPSLVNKNKGINPKNGYQRSESSSSVEPPAVRFKLPVTDADDDDDGKNHGTEVVYGQVVGPDHGNDDNEPTPVITTSIELPPPPPTYELFAPPTKRDSPPPVAAKPPPKSSNNGGNGGGFFGFGGRKNSHSNQSKASRAQLADATELTRFALAALEDKDASLAAQRLQQALDALHS